MYLHVCHACQDSMCTCNCTNEPMVDQPEIGRKRFEAMFKKHEPLSLDEIKVLVEKAAKWAESEEGRAKLQDAMRKAKETIEWLEKERKLTWEQLNTPMSI